MLDLGLLFALSFEQALPPTPPPTELAQRELLCAAMHKARVQPRSSKFRVD